jgi:transcriptional regulator with XRE-family HTH domain
MIIKQVYLYGLIDPRNGLLRYVGVTRKDRLHIRFKEHLDLTSTANLQKTAWVQELHSLGLRPIIILLDKGLYTNYAMASDAEQEAITWLRSIQEEGTLLNIRPGGDARGGCDGHFILSDTELLLAFDLKQEGWQQEKIAKKINCHPDYISRVLRGYTRGYLKEYWEMHNGAVQKNKLQKRLDDIIGFKIFDYHCKMDIEITDIGRNFDVTKQYVLAILAGKNKPHIKEEWERINGNSEIRLQKIPIPIEDSTGKIFKSIGDAERFYATTRDTILRSILNGRPSFRLGIQFSYADKKAKCKVSNKHAQSLKTSQTYGGVASSNPTKIIIYEDGFE